jgi:hypothetical protein
MGGTHLNEGIPNVFEVESESPEKRLPGNVRRLLN